MTAINLSNHFVDICEVYYKDSGKHKRRLESALPDDFTVRTATGKVMTIRKLLNSADLFDSGLLQAAIQDTLMQSATYKRVMRNAIMPETMNHTIERIPVPIPAGVARSVGEGAEVPLFGSDFTYVDLVATKIGERTGITQEMVEENQFGAIAHHIKMAGESLENRLNMDALTTLVHGSHTYGHVVDTNGVNQGRLAISKAITLLNKSGYEPNTMVVSPIYEEILRDEMISTFNTSSAQSTDMLSRGTAMSPFMGVTPYMTNIGVNDDKKRSQITTSVEWGENIDGQVLAVVYDYNCAQRIGMRRDITSTTYNDPLRDLASNNEVFTARFAHEFVRANAKSAVAIVA